VPAAVLRRQAGRGVPGRAVLPALALSAAAGAAAAQAVRPAHAVRLRVREEQAVRLLEPRGQRAADLREALLAALGERAAAGPGDLPAGADRRAAAAHPRAQARRGSEP